MMKVKRLHLNKKKFNCHLRESDTEILSVLASDKDGFDGSLYQLHVVKEIVFLCKLAMIKSLQVKTWQLATYSKHIQQITSWLT